MLRHLLLIALLLTPLCSARNNDKDKSNSKGRFQQPRPIHLDKAGQKWADKTLRKMLTEEKVGQLFGIKVLAQFLNDADPIFIQLRDNLRKYHIGSLVMTVPMDGAGAGLLKSQPDVAADLLNRLQKSSKLPLIVAADFERGVSMRLNGATVFPHAMAFGATGKTENAGAFGRITALEARAIGVHWNFFPDADVNSNPANPIINTRSFGEDPKQVGDFVAAYIRGAHQGSMLTTAKHFPGHGDTAADSHLGLAQVTGDRAHLEAVELPPFRRAIEAGVDAVMVAHVTVPALDSEPNRVATTSRAIVDGLLKEEMGFKGIVVTDALDMAALTRLYAQNSGIGRAAVDSFNAGNDVLIIPADLDASYRALLEALHSGEISGQRLDQSVRKILELKASLGLNKARLVDPAQLSSAIAKPENVAVGQRIADEAITLVRDNGKVIPLQSSLGTLKPALPYQSVTEVSNRLVALILADDLRTDSGRMLEHQILARVPDARVIYVERTLGRRHEAVRGRSGGSGGACDRRGLCGSNRGQGHARRRWRFDKHRCYGRCHRIFAQRNPRSRRQSHCSTRYGQSLCGAGFPRDPELCVRVLQCDRFGNSSRESDLRRDPDRRSSAGDDSGHRIPRRWDRTPRPA